MWFVQDEVCCGSSGFKKCPVWLAGAKTPVKYNLNVTFHTGSHIWVFSFLSPQTNNSLILPKGDTGCWFTMPFTAVQTGLLIDILEIFNTRKFLNPLLGNCLSIDVFPIEEKEERERRNEERDEEHGDFYKQAIILVSICSPVAVFAVLSKNTTLELGTADTTEYF